MRPTLVIRAVEDRDETAVLALWQACDLTRPWNDARQVMAHKRRQQPELFLVGELSGQLVASVMAGDDGTRGWVHYLGVLPSYQGQGLGQQLMQHVERALAERGCPKLNLQVRSDNAAVIAFYRRLGYLVDDVMSLGKRLDGG